MHLLYIHGFLSSPVSHKAVQVKNWLNDERSDIEYHCPALTPYPNETRQTLEAIVETLQSQPVGLVGSSLGGYWATWLAEKYDLRAVLVNPAVKPSILKPDYVNVELRNYHTDESYLLKEEHMDDLLAVDVPVIKQVNNYWLMVQTGDETLDYRLATEKYAACKQLVENGGDHSFQDFEQWIPDIVDFLFPASN